MALQVGPVPLTLDLDVALSHLNFLFSPFRIHLQVFIISLVPYLEEGRVF
jgi:hypothetical protein